MYIIASFFHHLCLVFMFKCCFIIYFILLLTYWSHYLLSYKRNKLHFYTSGDLQPLPLAEATLIGVAWFRNEKSQIMTHDLSFIHVEFWNLFYGLSLPSADSKKKLSLRKIVHWVLVNRLVVLSLTRISVVKLTDHTDMIIAVYRGRSVTEQQHVELKNKFLQTCTLLPKYM